MKLEIIAQAIGIVAMFFNIFSYQQRSARGVIAFQFFGGLLFAINFFMLGAYIGAILNAIAVVRAILFLKKDVFKTDRLFWIPIFVTAFFLAYIATFTVFDQAFTLKNAVIEVLPVIGMVSTTLAFRHKEAKIIRRYSLVSSCSWLVYNSVNLAVGAICCEAFSLVSIVIAMFRLDIKRNR